MWSSNGPLGVCVSVGFFIASVCLSGVVKGQYFDPNMDDKTYLDNLQNKIETEVNSTKAELFTQGKIVELLAKQFVAAQLKENLFIALRVLAEKELKQLHEQQNEKVNKTEIVNSTSTELSISSVLPRQDDGDDDDGETPVAVVATTIRAADQAMYQMGLIPQVANLIKAIFGGNQNINLTNYVSSATRLLPKPVGTQVVGLVSSISTPIAPGSQRPGTQGTSIGIVNNGRITQGQPIPVLVQQNQINRVNQINQSGFNQFQPQQVAPQFQTQRVTPQFQNQQVSPQFQNQQVAPQYQPQQVTQQYQRYQPQQAVSKLQQDIDNPQSFKNQFNSIQLSSVGGPPTKRESQSQFLTTSKSYVYNPSGSKGVAGASATLKPQLSQQLNTHQFPQQVSSGQYQPGQQQQTQQVQQLQQPQQVQQLQQPQQVQQQPQRVQQPQIVQVQLLQHQQSQYQQQLWQQQQQQIQQQQSQRQQPQQVQQSQRPQRPQQAAFPQTRPTPDEDEDEDGDDDGRKKRQFSLASFLPTVLGNVIRPTNPPSPPRTPGPVHPRPVNTLPQAPQGLQQIGPNGQLLPPPTVPLAVGQPEAVAQPAVAPVPMAAMMPEAFNLRTFATNVGKNIGDIVKIMPDLFRGAREGVQLLQTLSSVLGGLDGLGDIAGGILE